MNIHSQNRDKLIDFLKTDLIGPMTNNKSLDFEELDTSKKIVFNNAEDAFKLFKDKETGEEILHMPQRYRFNPLHTYTSGVLYSRNEKFSSIEDLDSDNLDPDNSEEENLEDEDNKIELIEPKFQNRFDEQEDLTGDIDIGAVNEKKPNAMAISFLANVNNNTEVIIDLSGGSYQPLATYMPKSETKKQVKDTVVPEENFEIENLLDSKVWWLNISGENYKKVVERGTLFSPNYEGNHWSHNNQAQVKKGDVFVIYSDLAIRSLGIAKSDNEIIENGNTGDIDFIKSLKTENNNADEYNKVTFYSFELSLPILKDDIELDERIKENQRFDKYATFTKKGNAGYHHLSEISDEFLNYLKHRFLSFWPTQSPFGVTTVSQNITSYDYTVDNNLVSNTELWNHISSLGKTFSLEELHSNVDSKINLDVLKIWLSNCVELNHLQIINKQYSLSSTEELYNTFYLRKDFNKKIAFKGSSVLEIADRGYVKLEEENSNFVHEGLILNLRIFVRKHSQKEFILTVIFENLTESDFASQPETSLFQSKIKLTALNGNDSCILPYPSNTEYNLDHEFDQETLKFAMLYSENKTYAVGHGTSVGWNSNDEIFSDTMPVAEVKQLTPDIKNPITDKEYNLNIHELTEDSDYKKLDELLNNYEKWIKSKEKDKEYIEEVYSSVAESNISECFNALERMRLGLELIQTDPKIRKAFQLANQAIYNQQILPSYKRKLIKYESNQENPEGEFVFEKPLKEKMREPSWRPFQIAFFLLNIESIAHENSKDRLLVDLLWFPTGGGKTEAYLGLIAFNLFLERLNGLDTNRTSVIMRYTLRLLTAQQFERASKLICSMEVIREENLSLLGEARFTIGIFVGGATSYNTSQQALDNYKLLKDNEWGAKNKFVISKCPWCGAEIGFNETFKKIVGLKRRKTTVIIKCHERSCNFRKGLPIYVIDEEIYEHTPSLIIATVDKFARVAWRKESRKIFGFDENGDRVSDPPSLIIQDELHLISNALGSAVGFYETVLERMCTRNFSSDTEAVPPKIICSTATIRNSAKQLLGLYGRKSSLIFPPSGLSIKDSFFAVEDTKREAKFYMGIFSPSLSTQQTQVDVYASQYVVPEKFDNCEEKDPLWTNVLYFNSIRELQATKVLLSDNFKRRLQYTQVKYKTNKESYINPPGKLQIEELTSRLPSEQVVEKLDLLFKDPCNYPNDSLRFLLATNIIEVGIDVPRLSLMTILNQPKNTSQYIQVSGRVGRKSETPPVICTIFSPLRPRDKSHYENFKTFHEKLYMGVEPTSVTPFSDAAVKKMLEGAFFMYLSCVLPFSFFNSDFDFPQKEFDDFKDLMINRSKKILNSEEFTNSPIEEYINDIYTKWLKLNPSIYMDEFNKKYMDETPLIIQSGSWVRHFHTGSFQVPNSMRSVDGSARGQIMKHYNKAAQEEIESESL